MTSVNLTWQVDDIGTVYADGVQIGHTHTYSMVGHVEIPGKNVQTSYDQIGFINGF